MLLTLNIGTITNNGTQGFNSYEILARVTDKFDSLGFIVISAKTKMVDYAETKEKTVIIKLFLAAVSTQRTIENIDKVIFELSNELAQDCIARYIENAAFYNGALIGANASKYGAFNPEYFHHA